MDASREATRRNFIKTLEETAEIAEACGERIAKAVLFSLIGALLSGRERELAIHMREFSEKECQRIEAEIATQRAMGE